MHGQQKHKIRQLKNALFRVVNTNCVIREDNNKGRKAQEAVRAWQPLSKTKSQCQGSFHEK
jgi:hypothetical protein